MLVSYDARVVVHVCDFCWPLPCLARVHTDSASVVAVSYSEGVDSCSGPGNSGHSLAFPGNDCRLASDWGHQVGTTWCSYCKHLVKGEGGTGNWVEEE